MPSGSISFKTQLLSTIVGSIVATAVALTTLAYRAQVDSLERDARRAVRIAAQSRADAIARLIDGEQQRAERFLVAAAALCGEPTASGGTAWELGCAQRALRELRVSERAAGALLIHRRRRIARSGASVSDREPIPTPLARVIEREEPVTYMIRAETNETAVDLKFTLDEMAALFEQPLGLGAGGEIFLRDVAGAILTPTRFGSAARRVASGEWSRVCTLEPSEEIVVDYRGVETVRGVHAVSGFAQPICVEAHLSHAEALAPADALLSDLITRAAEFAAVGIVLALIAAHWMSAPVQRLAASARAFEQGDLTQSIPVAGPSEIRSLAAAFAAMGRALSQQMSREQRARHDAEAANHAKDEFLAVISHELRTPLTSMLGWARLLRRGGFQSTQATRAVAAIESSARVQKRLIEDLLDVSRIIAGRLQLDCVAIQVDDPVRAALEEVRPIAEDKEIAIEGLFESTPSLSADPLRVQQIVTNLLTNAIKFTPSGGCVTVCVREADGQAEIAVKDTGVGIAPEFLPHVFEPFRQADAGPRRAYGGLGLGLSIAHHLVKLHRGTIEATSRGVGTGATFLVRLPLVRPETSRGAGVPSPTADGLPNDVMHPIRLDDLRVLVVEDDDATRHVVAALLEEAGARVDDVASAAEGHQRLSQHRYSAIVSDLAMPHEDGFSFMRTVRRTIAGLPALALTGLTRNEDTAAAYAAGFQMCLTKPVDRDKLITAIAELTLRKTA